MFSRVHETTRLTQSKSYHKLEHRIYVVACLLKARTVEPAETATARERLCKSHVSVATVVQATMEVPLKMVFSILSTLTAMSPSYRVTARSVSCGVRREAILVWQPIGAVSWVWRQWVCRQAVWERSSWALARKPWAELYSRESVIRKCSPWAVRSWGIAIDRRL
jgi:hypothetical protein